MRLYSGGILTVIIVVVLLLALAFCQKLRLNFFLPGKGRFCFNISVCAYEKLVNSGNPH